MLSPGVVVSAGAVIRDSVIMNDVWIGPGAVVDRVVLDKQVVVGPGARLGWGDDLSPNRLLPDRLDTGITVVGKNAHIPAGMHIGRNVLVAADVDEDDFDGIEGNVVSSGETVAPSAGGEESGQ
jgi:glucose-1-phosphate adenylyltransferase